MDAGWSVALTNRPHASIFGGVDPAGNHMVAR